MKNSLLVNGEELLAMKAIMDQVKAELALSKKNVDVLQTAIINMGVEIKTLRNEQFLLKSYVDRIMNTKRNNNTVYKVKRQ
jgi:hypothetical protein